MSTIITIELCAEDRARLDRIIAALEGGKTMPEVVEETPAPVAQEPAEAPPAEPPAVTTPEPEKPAEAEISAQFTKSDIQRKVVSLSAAGRKDEVRNIVKAYADRVSAIPEDKVDEVMAKLAALEG